MNTRDCSTCLYGDLCRQKHVCPHYTPSDEKMMDAELDEYIENARKEYRNEWQKYINECVE